MKKISKEFTKHESRIKAWACVDSQKGVVGLFETREEARDNKRYAAKYGHAQMVAKLVFEEFVR
jgi:hypothetical protein